METFLDKLLEFWNGVVGISENAESISGEISEISGDISSISGDISSISGDITEISGDVESIFGFIDSIAESGAAIAASTATTAIAIVSLVTLGISILNFLLDIVVYLFRSIGMYNLSKKAGRSDGWLAFVPVAWHYVLCDISDKPFKLFGKNIGKNPGTAFWLWLILKYLGGWLVDLLGILLSTLVMAIPTVGPAIGSVMLIILPFLPNLICAILRGKFLYGAAEVFRPGHRGNKAIAVFCILVEEFLSSDFMTLLLVWSLLKYDPVHKKNETETEAETEPITEAEAV